MFAVFALVLPSPEVWNSCWYLGVFCFFWVCFEFVVHEESFHSMPVSDFLYTRLTTALVPTVLSLCAKHRETFWRLNCLHPLCDQRVVAGVRQSGQP